MNKLNKTAAILAMLSLGMLAGCSSSTKSDSSTSTSSSSNQTSNSNSSASSNSSEDDSEKDDAIDLTDTSVVKAGTVNLDDYSKPIEISSAGTYTLTGTTDQMVYIKCKDTEINLVLDNATITNPEGPAIFVRSASKVNITVKGDNTISSAQGVEYEALNACLYSKADLVFDGSGTLTIQSEYGHGIKAKDTATFKDGTYVITAQDDGIHSNEECVIENGNYTILANNDEGIQSETSLEIQNGTFSISAAGDALRAETTLQIDDGTFDITTNNEGIESKDSLVINGGTININAADDGINAANSLVINGGTVTAVSSTNDGIDSNGTLEINGGNVTAIGLRSPETAYDVDNTPFIINGGTIFGAGSNTTYPTSYKQNVLLVGAGTGSISNVSVQSDGKTILSFDVSASSTMGSSNANLIISSDLLETGKTYTVLVNQSSVGDITISEGINTLGSISSMGGGMMGNQNGGGQNGGMMGGNQGGFGAGNRR
jgi:hypothetical protein